MADMKSMLPDLKDVTSIASKLYHDLKKSVSEIVTDYKGKHCAEKDAPESKAKPKAKAKH